METQDTTEAPNGGLVLGAMVAAMVTFFALLTVAIVVGTKAWQRRNGIPTNKQWFLVRETDSHVGYHPECHV